MSTLLLTQKTYVPRPLEGWVDRPRLFAQLQQAQQSQRRIVLVSAMAGCGKSTLLIGWAAKCQQKVAWLSLDAQDNTLPVFWAYLIRAVQQPYPEFAASVLASLLSPQPPPVEILLAEFINQAVTLPDRLVLILDDYHLIDSPAIHDSLVYLVEHLPPTLCLVLSTRSDPPLSLSRWRVRGYLAEIRVEQLRFTTHETSQFLRDFMSLVLDEADITTLETSTEGWAAGLQLAGLALQNLRSASGENRAQKNFIARFSANHHYVLDYLTSEVLNQQPEELRNFLLQTSILRQLSGPLCQAVTGQEDSADLLALLYQRNLFLIPLDEEAASGAGLGWFRYHHLFAEMLRVRLARMGAERISTFHISAARWYEQAGRVGECLHHALQANAYEYAAQVVGRNWRSATDNGQANVAIGWIETLPSALVQTNPFLSLAAACTQWIRGNAEVTQRHSEDAIEAHRLWSDQGFPAHSHAEWNEPEVQKGYLPALEFETIPSQAASMLSLVAVRRERLGEAEHMARQAIQLSFSHTPISGGLAYMALATALRDQGRFDEAIEAYRTAIPLFRKAGNRITETNSSFNLGRLLMIQNRLSEAERFFQDSIRRSGSAALTPADAILQVWLGDIHYERNQLQQASALLAEAWPMAHTAGYLELVKNSTILKARLLRANGNVAEAIAVLEEGAEAVQRTDARNLLAEIQSVLAWFQAEVGQLESGLALAQAAPLTIGGRLPSVSAGFQALNLARVHILVGNIDPVLQFAVQFEAQAEIASSHQWQIEALLLQAAAYETNRQTQLAQTALFKALALAQPEQCIRIFLDSGPAILAMLKAAYPTVQDAALARFIARILDASQPPTKTPFPGIERAALEEPLSEREVQVLRLLSRGLSNREIADQLVISLATAKTHLRHIFEKLGAENRVEAINRANQRGLI